MTGSVITPAGDQVVDLGLRQRKPGASVSKEPTDMDTDAKDKEEVTWGKTASGEGKLQAELSMMQLIQKCSRYLRPTRSSTLSQQLYTAPP